MEIDYRVRVILLSHRYVKCMYSLYNCKYTNKLSKLYLTIYLIK